MRRTKEDAARTREAIVDAALACFDRHGIARTTLEQIASGAGVTKGAIYWHFSGKRAILHAIREEVSIPLLDRADCTLLNAGERPALERIERFLCAILEALEKDPATRRAFSVMQFKCEYTDELAGELADMLRNNERLATALGSAYAQARKGREVAASLAPRLAALETLVFLSGLVRLWLIDRSRDGVRKNGLALIRAHVRGRAP